MSNKRFFMFWVLLFMIVMPFCAAAEVLWIQPLSSSNDAPFTSQYDNPPGVGPNQSIYIADDFVNADAWDITSIFVPGTFWAGTTLLNATSLTWSIYSNNGGVPAGYPGGGAPYWTTGSLLPTDPQVTLTAGSDALLSNTLLTLSTPLQLPAGHWWLVFYPEASYGAGYSIFGWGRQASDITDSGFTAKSINPGSGFPSWGGPGWIDWNSAVWANPLTQTNTAFRLDGTVVVPTPDIAVSADLAFGSVLVGTTSVTQTVTVTNTGDADLSISAITITTPGANADQFAKSGGTCGTTFPKVLAAGTNCTQFVTFSPTSVGAKSATLAITSNDPDTLTANVGLSGTGISPDIAVSADLAFGSVLVGTTSVTQTVTITNTGDADLSISAITITTPGANADQFAKSGGTCGTTFPKVLAAGTNCTQFVTFSPTSVGAKSATLAITSNDPDTLTANVGLSGTGISPDIAVSADLAFGSVLVGTTSVTQTVTITNTGDADLSISAITITTPGANADQFAKSGGTCGTTFPKVLAAGTNCTQFVTFSPTSVGAKSATLAITSNDPDTLTANVGLSGTGISPDIDVAPVALDFDPKLVGATSAAREVTISNIGTAPLVVNSIVTSGTNASMFAVATGGTTPCASLTPTIAVAANCTVNVTFTPTSVGAKSASLDVSSNDGVTPIANVPLTGTGIQGELSVTEGTIGTEIIINGSGFGESKGKVFIGDVKIKVAKDGWTPTRITCTANKVPLPGELKYDVTIQPKPKGTPAIPLSGAFTVRKPYINPLTSDDHGAPEAEVTLRGLWFGTKKGKVYVGEQKCKVKSWDMDPLTGASTVLFVVHKKLLAGPYLLELENKVGRSLTFGFSVP